MKVKLSIEQEIDLDDAFSNDLGFEIYGPDKMSTDDTVEYLVNRFVEDIDYLVKYNEVKSAVAVEYIEE
jgi:hypothetical protein